MATAWFPLVVQLLIILLCCYENEGSSNERICIPLEGIEMCEPLVYVNISLPNPRGHLSYTQVNKELEDFEQLILSGCSSYLRHFLCAYYAPLCRDYLPVDLNILPCQELCLHVKKRCESLVLLTQHPDAPDNYTWPEHLQCNLFPTKTQAPWCFGPDNIAQLQEDSIQSSTEYLLPVITIKPVAATTSTSITTTASSSTSSIAPSSVNCTPLSSDSVCSLLDYKEAKYPNTMGDTTQQEAEHKLHETFNIIMMYECSPNLITLLCYYYHPNCNTVIKPCRELCIQVTDRCKSAVKNWPQDLDCTQLPSNSSSTEVCSMGDSYPTVIPTVIGVERGMATRNMATSITIIIIITLFCYYILID